jgi:PAS domain S-box-containing protein
MDFTDILKDFAHLDNGGVPSEQATAAANAAAAASSSSSSSSSSNHGGYRFGEKTIGDIAGGHTHSQDLDALFDGDFGDKVVNSVGRKRVIAAASSSSSSSSSSSHSRGGTTTSAHGVITVPPTLPSRAPVPAAMGGRSGMIGGNSSSSRNVSNFNESSQPFQDPFEQEGVSMGNDNNNYRDDDDDDEEEDDDDYDRGRSNRRKKQRTGGSASAHPARGADPDSLSLTEQQKLERRERNREHAKRSRIRKKVLLDLLQDQLSSLRAENVKLRQVIGAKVPAQAAEILARCTTEESMLLVSDEEGESERENDDGDNNPGRGGDRGGRDAQPGDRRSRRQTLSFRDGGNDGMGGRGDVQGGQGQQQHARVLMEPDFRLIQALCGSQQNFVLSDPSLPDNPIVYCSEGFCKITGYKRHQIIGRNCRFLQGPGTDQNAVDIIRKGVAEGKDISVCLLNYKANGTPFWNQFFVAPLKDADGAVVNYVGVQCEVNIPPISKIKDRVKRLPIDG